MKDVTWRESEKDRRMWSSSEDVQMTKLEVAEEVMVETLANRIRRHDGEMDSCYDRYQQICRQMGIEAHGTALANRPGTGFIGHFSPRERIYWDKIRLDWMAMGGEEESYQVFIDRMIDKAEALIEAEDASG